MEKLQGIPASPGIAIGKVFFFFDDNFKVPEYDISESEVASEIERFDKATEKAINEIEDLRRLNIEETGGDRIKILDAHILMLKDAVFLAQIGKDVAEQLRNVESILFETMNELMEKLNSASDVYLRERAIDIHDVSKRVLNHLMYRERISLADLSEEVILVTHNLLPSDTIAMNKRMVKGIAMDAGGKTSHTAILARAFEIPAVLGLSTITRYVRSGDSIIVDGNAGVVIVEPDGATLERYRSSSQKWTEREISLLTLNELPAETRDGKLVELMANIEIPEETDSVLSHGADGIGLYRSEFLFLQPGRPASEEEQFDAYSRVIRAMGSKPVTIRTLDLGGDKVTPEMGASNEHNPILGWRAVRFCLSNRDIFKTQLRALLRASVFGDLRIMFPMISGIEELNNVLEVLEESKSELRRKGISFKEDLQVGCMIEVPSAAMTSDILAKKSKFLSIGTNDLIQYTIAVDRGNEKIAYLYEPFHPGVLRLLKVIIDNAHEQGIPVAMCGEMAGDPFATVILLGLGLDGFSMSAFGIPEIKRIIRSVTLLEAEEIVGIVMAMKTYLEIDRYVSGWMKERFDVDSF